MSSFTTTLVIGVLISKAFGLRKTKRNGFTEMSAIKVLWSEGIPWLWIKNQLEGRWHYRVNETLCGIGDSILHSMTMSTLAVIYSSVSVYLMHKLILASNTHKVLHSTLRKIKWSRVILPIVYQRMRYGLHIVASNSLFWMMYYINWIYSSP